MGTGFCECGCGGATSIATQTHSRLGVKAGEHFRFITGHNMRPAGPDYIVDLESGCWIWQREQTSDGYGRKRLAGGGRKAAHRWHYEQEHGPIPDGMQLDHLCRNRACCNPDHLEAVSARENCRRGLRTKLTDAQVREIRRAPGRQADIAARFGIAVSYVSRIKARKERVDA